MIFFIVIQLKADWLSKSTYLAVKEIQLSQNQWTLRMTDKSYQQFDKAKILIHNEIFQLIQLSNLEKNKIVVLFNDQMPFHQLQLLHLRQLKN